MEAAGRPRASCQLRKNARELAAVDLPELVDLVVADVSFISVKKVLPGAWGMREIGSRVSYLDQTTI